MAKSTVRPTDDEIVKTVKSYSNMLYKLCFTILCSSADAEDAVSDTLLKYITKSPNFNSEEHKKAWLINVAVHISLDIRRFNLRRNYVNLDKIAELCPDKDKQTPLLEMLDLPEKYKTVLHLFYIEGYKTRDIAKMLNISESAARKRLQYGRERLKLEYGKED